MGQIDAADIVFEHSGTIHRDFSHSRYEPIPTQSNRFHSGTMLKHLLRTAGLQLHLHDILLRLREHLGEDETIWGVKFANGQIASVEFYISNREEPSPLRLRSFDTLQEILSPWLDGFVQPPTLCPYTMISLEIDLSSAQRSRATSADFYVSSHLRAVSKDGYSYELGKDSIILKNHYRHFTLPEIEDLKNRILFSPRILNHGDIDSLLPVGYHGCRSISYAAKPMADGLYFRRIPIIQAIEFSKTFGLGDVGEVLEEHRDDFVHLSWDVGVDFDFLSQRDDAPICGKAAIYGLW